MATRLIHASYNNAQAQAEMDLAQPGDTVSFERGGVWAGGLQMNKSGTDGNVITYTAHGTGPDPIITNKEPLPGWTVAGNWTRPDAATYPNVWRIAAPNDTITYRLWINGVEARRASKADDNFGTAAFTTTINATDNYYSDGRYASAFYVYCTGNPADTFSSMEWTGSDILPFNTNTQTYWVVDGLDIRGGKNSCFQIYNSSNFLVQNCTIGKECNRNGLVCWHRATDGVITNNVIDTGLEHYWNYYIDMYPTNDGFYMTNGAHRLTFIKNTIRNFMHSGIGVEADWFTGQEYTDTLDNGHAMSDVTITDNLIECTTVSYMRGIGMACGEGRTTQNVKVSRNWIRGCPINSQIGMDYVEISYNIWSDNSRNPLIQPQSLGSFGGLTLAGGNTTMGRYMKVFNNTFVNLADQGIRISFGAQNWIISDYEPGAPTISFSSSSNIVTASPGYDFTAPFGPADQFSWQVGDYVWARDVNTSPNVYHNIIGRVAAISPTQITLTTNAVATKSNTTFMWVRMPSELAYNTIENNILYNCGYNTSQSDDSPPLPDTAIMIENTINPYPNGGPVDGYVHHNTFRNNIVYTPGKTDSDLLVYDNRHRDTAISPKLTVSEFNTLVNGFHGDVISGNQYIDPLLFGVEGKQYWPSDGSPANSGGIVQTNAEALATSSSWPDNVTTTTLSADAWPIGAYGAGAGETPPPAGTIQALWRFAILAP